jgi:rhodanese-related sulfurtransferase
MSEARPGPVNRALGRAALALGVLAPLAGSPYASRHAQVDVQLLATAVAREDDHVTAVELAQWIKERRPGLRVVDVRSAAEFDAYHVPLAERIPVDSLAAAPFHSNETIVLYSEGGTHAAQGWVFLRAMGYQRVYFLRGGLYEWLEQVMNPTLALTASDSERAAFALAAPLSRYFGGVPRPGVSPQEAEAIALPGTRTDSGRAGAGPSTQNTTALAVQRIRKRGC